MKQINKNPVFILLLFFPLVIFQCKEKVVLSEPDEKAPYHKGKVIETMNSSGYTYILLKNEKGKFYWMALMETSVKTGDTIIAPEGYIMRNFTSKSLQRTFPVILFTTHAQVENKNNNSASGSAKEKNMSFKKLILGGNDVSGANRYTVHDCYQNAEKLNGQKISIRGKVVKFLPGIMGKNWIHLQDGTGAEGSNDLTITTLAQTKVGDTIVATGTLVKNKDLGSGYKYPIIMEEAVIATENETSDR